MRMLSKIDEFKSEASNALFTRQQALSTTLYLLKAELASPENDEEETRILNEAIQHVSLHYLDETETATDAMLDSLGVARLTAEDVVRAIEVLIFEAE